MLPKQSQLEIPLLEILAKAGGQTKPKDVYQQMKAYFPEVTEDDFARRYKGGEDVWTNSIQWCRQHLIDSGDMSSPQRGVWAITDKGRQRLNGKATTAATMVPPTSHPSLVELHERYEAQFRSKLLDKLHQLSPTQFEHFAKEFLTIYGFVQVEVTQVSRDGGIDGHGMLKVGLARMAVAFQCKRWEGNVGRQEVDKFRGAIQGEYEQGIFFATSDFTKEAKGASLRRGAVPIVLLNGESIVELMIEKEFGVQKRPLVVYEDELDSLFGDHG